MGELDHARTGTNPNRIDHFLARAKVPERGGGFCPVCHRAWLEHTIRARREHQAQDVDA